MAGLPWIKVRVDLARDPRSLHLDDLLGEPRAWTYLLQLRLYLAEHAATGRVSGAGAVAAVERAAGWTGARGKLVDALRDAGFVRAGPARDGGGTEVEDLDWASEQGAHVAKFQRDATKPRGNRVNVVSPSRDIEGTRAGPASTPRGESRELRVESREEDLFPAVASAPAAPPKPRKATKAQEKPADPRHAPLVKELVETCRTKTGKPYGFRGGQDARWVTELLSLADQDPDTTGEAAPREVLRRWKIGLAWRWKNGEAPVQDLHALYQRWQACASPSTAPPLQASNGPAMSDFSDVLGDLSDEARR